MAFSSKIGSAKFHFLAGATAPATLTNAALYLVKFPECPAELSVNVDSLDNEEPVNGVLGITRSVITKAAFEYTLKLKSFDFNILSFFLGGATPSSATPPSTISVGTDLAHTGWGLVEWYDNGDSAGTPSAVHSGFTCQIIPDGSFSLDPTKFTELSMKIKITGTRGTLT